MKEGYLSIPGNFLSFHPVHLACPIYAAPYENLHKCSHDLFLVPPDFLRLFPLSRAEFAHGEEGQEVVPANQLEKTIENEQACGCRASIAAPSKAHLSVVAAPGAEGSALPPVSAIDRDTEANLNRAQAPERILEGRLAALHRVQRLGPQSWGVRGPKERQRFSWPLVLQNAMPRGWTSSRASASPAIGCLGMRSQECQEFCLGSQVCQRVDQDRCLGASRWLNKKKLQADQDPHSPFLTLALLLASGPTPSQGIEVTAAKSWPLSVPVLPCSRSQRARVWFA